MCITGNGDTMAISSSQDDIKRQTISLLALFTRILVVLRLHPLAAQEDAAAFNIWKANMVYHSWDRVVVAVDVMMAVMYVISLSWAANAMIAKAEGDPVLIHRLVFALGGVCLAQCGFVTAILLPCVMLFVASKSTYMRFRGRIWAASTVLRGVVWLVPMLTFDLRAVFALFQIQLMQRPLMSFVMHWVRAAMLALTLREQGVAALGQAV